LYPEYSGLDCFFPVLTYACEYVIILSGVFFKVENHGSN
jgi:hypothetical protein